MSAVTQSINVADIPAIPRAEAFALAGSQNDALLTLLRDLSQEEWETTTDCAPWTPRDIAAHLLAWAEAVLSPKEMFGQMGRAFKIRKEWASIVDAQNEIQVRERKSLSGPELVSKLEAILPRFLTARRRLSYVLKPIPTYNALVGLVSLGFVAETIFTRDMLIHRIDISEATGRELPQGPDEARLVADCVKEWAKRSKANARLVLSGAAGGDFVTGTGATATINAKATDFLRLLSGRPEGDSVSIEGDAVAARSWISKGCRF